MPPARVVFARGLRLEFGKLLAQYLRFCHEALRLAGSGKYGALTPREVGDGNRADALLLMAGLGVEFVLQPLVRLLRVLSFDFIS